MRLRREFITIQQNEFVVMTFVMKSAAFVTWLSAMPRQPSMAGGQWWSAVERWTLTRSGHGVDGGRVENDAVGWH